MKTTRNLTYIVGVGIVYGKRREPNPFVAFGEKALMKNHLERLIHRGSVGLKNGIYWALRDKGGAV